MNQYKRKRFAIFVMYDKEGVVDNYITFLLCTLKDFFSELVIVCNGGVLEIEKNKLAQFADQIVIRENKGFDIMAWRSIILEYLAQGRLQSYDELIIFNDSFYGPVNSFQDMFHKMDGQDIDFWGITRHPESYDTVRGLIPEHIQSFFMGIRNRMFMSNEFLMFWEKLDLSDKGLLDAILAFELTFTNYFSRCGYRWKAYTETENLDAGTDRTLNFNPYYLTPLELIRDYKCPIVKKKALVDKNLQAVAGEEAERVIDFIKDNTDYDPNLIWDNLIRIMPKKVLYEAFHMNYVLAPIGDESLLSKNKIVLYIRGISKNIETFVCRNKDITFRELGEEEQINFSDADEYDYIGMLSFDRINGDNVPDTLYRRNDLLDNMFQNEGYLANIIQLLNHHEKLGVLYPLIRNRRKKSKNESFYRESFWCRREFISNPEKYLYGTICTKEYATLKLSQYREQIDSMVSAGGLPDIFNREDIFSKPELTDFLNQNERFYVFGTGIYGRKMMQILKDQGKKLEAFVVSDGQPLVKVDNDIEVWDFSGYLSAGNKKYGLIIALSKKFQNEVIDQIRDSGLINVYYL